MNDTPPRNVDDYAALWAKLIGPIFVCLLGSVGFMYEIAIGHNATLGTIGAGLAAAGASLSSDIFRKAA